MGLKKEEIRNRILFLHLFTEEIIKVTSENFARERRIKAEKLRRKYLESISDSEDSLRKIADTERDFEHVHPVFTYKPHHEHVKIPRTVPPQEINRKELRKPPEQIVPERKPSIQPQPERILNISHDDVPAAPAKRTPLEAPEPEKAESLGPVAVPIAPVKRIPLETPGPETTPSQEFSDYMQSNATGEVIDRNQKLGVPERYRDIKPKEKPKTHHPIMQDHYRVIKPFTTVKAVEQTPGLSGHHMSISNVKTRDVKEKHEKKLEQIDNMPSAEDGFNPAIAKVLAEVQPEVSEVPKGFSLGKLDSLLKDNSLLSVESPGPGKNVLVKKGGKILVTKLILSKEEIDSIIDKFADEARIPVSGGVVKAAVGNMVISAVKSDYVGSRFVINRTTPYSMIYK